MNALPLNNKPSSNRTKMHQAYLLLILVILSTHVHSNSFQHFEDIFPKVTPENGRYFSGIAVIAQGKNIEFMYSNNANKLNKSDTLPQLITNSQFVIGSISKQITAALILRLVDNDVIKLDQHIGSYLPNLKENWREEVTIRHLLNHTSGITDIDHPLKIKPGKEFKYNNLNYDLLGKISSHVTKRAYAALTNEIFSICGMDNTFPGEKSMAHGLKTKGYNEEFSHEKTLVTTAIKEDSIPSGGIISTANDLVLWSQCLHKGNLVSKNMHLEMVKKAATRKHRWGDLGYGFATQLYNKDQLIEWSHSGYVSGFISTLAYYPVKDVTLILLENTSWDYRDMDRVFLYHDLLRSRLIEGF